MSSGRDATILAGIDLGHAAVFGQDGAMVSHKTATSGLITNAVKALLESPAAAGDPPALESQRDWEDSEGRKLSAELINVINGTAILRKPDGSTVEVPKMKLSLKDRMAIDSFWIPLEPEALAPMPLSNSGDFVFCV